jgi:peptide deformylase
MTQLQPFQIIYAPNDIFRKKTEDIDVVDNSIREIADRMVKTMYVEGAVGIGANMVGVTKSIAVVDLRANGEYNPYIFINPKISWRSNETQKFEEASLSFPGISAEVERPSSIKLAYLDDQGKPRELDATGFFASVIQHEVDYLNGKIYLDYISKMKRDLLIKKMEKHILLNPPHVHGAHCHH